MAAQETDYEVKMVKMDYEDDQRYMDTLGSPANKRADLVTLFKTVQRNIDSFDEAGHVDMAKEKLRTALIDLYSILDYSLHQLWRHFNPNAEIAYKEHFPSIRAVTKQIESILKKTISADSSQYKGQSTAATGQRMSVHKDAGTFKKFTEVLENIVKDDLFNKLYNLRHPATHSHLPEVVKKNKTYCVKLDDRDEIVTRLLQKMYDFVCKKVSIFLYETRLIENAESCLYSLNTDRFVVHCEAPLDNTITEAKLVVTMTLDEKQSKKYETTESFDFHDSSAREKAAIELLKKVQYASNKIYNYSDCEPCQIPMIALQPKSYQALFNEFKTELSSSHHYSCEWQLNAFSWHKECHGQYKLFIKRKEGKKAHFVLSGTVKDENREYGILHIRAAATKAIIIALCNYSFLKLSPPKISVPTMDTNYKEMYGIFCTQLQTHGWKCELSNTLCNTYTTITLSFHPTEQVQIYTERTEISRGMRFLRGLLVQNKKKEEEEMIIIRNFEKSLKGLETYTTNCITNYAACRDISQPCVFCQIKQQDINNLFQPILTGNSDLPKKANCFLKKLQEVADSQICQESTNATTHDVPCKNLLDLQEFWESHHTELEAEDIIRWQGIRSELLQLNGLKVAIRTDLENLEKFLELMCNELDSTVVTSEFKDLILKSVEKKEVDKCKLTDIYKDILDISRKMVEGTAETEEKKIAQRFINRRIKNEIQTKVLHHVQKVLTSQMVLGGAVDECSATSIECLNSSDEAERFKNIIMRLVYIGILHVGI